MKHFYGYHIHRGLTDAFRKQDEMKWRFFKLLKSEEIFAENVATADESKYTALHHAVKWNDVEITKAVLAAGVDINARTGHALLRSTALHIAARLNHLEIGKLLVEAGADQNAKSKITNYTALQIATILGNEKFAKLLKEN